MSRISLAFCVAGGFLTASGISAMTGTTPTISLVLAGVSLFAISLMCD